MKNGFNWKKIILITVDVLLFIALIGVMVYSNQKDRSMAAELQERTAFKAEEEMQAEQERIDKEAEKAKKHEDVVAAVDGFLPGVVCWGDSLTLGSGGEGTSYPTVLQGLIDENICTPYNTLESSVVGISIPVVNMGVGGESSLTIIGRSGAMPFAVSEVFTIPQGTEPTPIKFTTESGAEVAPLRQGDAGMETVTIADVEGVIEVVQESPTSKKFSYTFRRLEGGAAKEVTVGTIIETAASEKYKNYIPILFIGQNGGWDNGNPQTLIDQQKNLINKQTQNNDRYIILGLTTGNASSRAGLEAAMQAAHGDRYINLRDYLSQQGMQDAGLEPTAADTAAMATGSVPPSLISEGVLLNEHGYKLIGEVTYKRMEQLGYFAEVLEATQEDETAE